jgi:asparagine synthase (glutamine-hydrolysing)
MDRMSMANSLEARSPFLDTALIEYMATIRATDKVGLRRVKPLLREGFRPLLPDEIWNRKKQGFGPPLGAWFRDELGTMFGDEVLAADARTATVLDQDVLGAMFAEHRRGEREHGVRLWAVLTLERWLRTLERPPADAPPAFSALSAT